MLKIRLFSYVAELKRQYDCLVAAGLKDNLLAQRTLYAYGEFITFILQNDLSKEYQLYLAGEPFIDEQVEKEI